MLLSIGARWWGHRQWEAQVSDFSGKGQTAESQGPRPNAYKSPPHQDPEDAQRGEGSKTWDSLSDAIIDLINAFIPREIDVKLRQGTLKGEDLD